MNTLKLKQIAEQPRCRISRQFMRTLTADRSISVSDGSALFFYTVLCSYAAAGISKRFIGDTAHTVHTGEWICHIDGIARWFRTGTEWKALAILDGLRRRNLISYMRLGSQRQFIKFVITNWNSLNTIYGSDNPCGEDSGFFFISTNKAADIIKSEHCSEMDVMLDLWINAVYNDTQAGYSAAAPVVYMGEKTNSTHIGYSNFAARRGVSKTDAETILKKLEQQDYLLSCAFSEENSRIILFLKNYLSKISKIYN